MLRRRSVMVIAPHADDETLGAGGTLLRLRAEGCEISWVLMTTPDGAGYPEDYVRTHAQQVDKVARAYGFGSVEHLRYPASSLSRQFMGELVDRLRDTARRFRPEMVLLPHAGDAHDDHRVTAQAVSSAFKSFRASELGVKALYAMEILSETGASADSVQRPFIPTSIVDISDFAERKLEVFSLYATEQTVGGPRSADAIRAQFTLHGNTYGVAAAERFCCLQSID